jgi:hypothetical protein
MCLVPKWLFFFFSSVGCCGCEIERLLFWCFCKIALKMAMVRMKLLLRNKKKTQVRDAPQGQADVSTVIDFTLETGGRGQLASAFCELKQPLSWWWRAAAFSDPAAAQSPTLPCIAREGLRTRSSNIRAWVDAEGLLMRSMNASPAFFCRSF